MKKKAEFDVGVWATQSKDQAAFQINNILGSLKYSLAFVLFSKPPEGKTDILPFATKRDLKIIFDKHPQYTIENTLCFTNFKNELIEYRENDVILPLYHPSLGYSAFDLDAHMYYVFEYLSVINSMRQKDKVNDVRELIKQVNYTKLVKVRSASTQPDRFKWDPSNFVRF